MVGPVVQTPQFRVKRIQTNVIALSERRLLNWLCAHLPAWTTSDQLTALSVTGAALVLVAEIASRSNPWFFWVASFGLVVNWFGDSLDGSLARYRHKERPIYGYFLDHTTDAFSNFMIMLGFGLTLYIRLDVAFFTLIGYFFLCMYVFINNHLSGVFQLSFLGFGPTELRLILVAINTGMFFFGPVGFTAFGQAFSYYDSVLLFGGVVFIAIYIVRMASGIVTLRHPSRSGAAPQPVPDTATSGKIGETAG